MSEQLMKILTECLKGFELKAKSYPCMGIKTIAHISVFFFCNMYAVCKCCLSVWFVTGVNKVAQI